MQICSSRQLDNSPQAFPTEISEFWEAISSSIDVKTILSALHYEKNKKGVQNSLSEVCYTVPFYITFFNFCHFAGENYFHRHTVYSN